MRRRRRDRDGSGVGFRYSAWDGTQRGFDLDADALLDALGDELVSHGDVHAALRRLLQQGLRDRNGEQLMGLREMLERLRQRRQQLLDRVDPDGVFDDISRQLREILDQERAGIERRV
jgi:uncharacterized protein with von Willebrand factor type A (vWA) domain